jgi:HAMP domain-containing protein
VRTRAIALALGLVLLAACGSTPSQRELADLRVRVKEAVYQKATCQAEVERVIEELADARTKFEAGEFPGGVISHVDAATFHAEQARTYCGDP